MANNMRWRYGDTNPVVMPVLSNVVIEIGDLIYSSSGNAYPASSLADAGTKAANQEAFHDAFAGVAMQASPSGSSESIRVATSGVFEFVVPDSSYLVGALMGADENAAGTQLLNQQAAGVATANLAIGRCAKADATGSGRLLVDVVSTLLKGGPQAMA